MSNFLIYTLWNTIQKIISAWRTALEFHLIGRSIVTDSYHYAMRVIAIFRRLFVDGTFEATFITHLFKQKDQPSFIRSVFYKMFKLCLLVIGLLIISSPIIAYLSVTDWTRGKLIIIFIIFFSPLIGLMFSMSFFTALLNANKRLDISSFSPIIGNIAFCAFLYLLCKAGFITIGIIVGNLIYAALQVLVMWYYCREYVGDHIIDLPVDFIEDTTKNSIWTILIPFTDVIIDRIALKIAVGSLSCLSYAHKIEQFIFSILAIPLSAMTISDFSKLASTHNEDVEFSPYSKKVTEIFILSHILILPITIFLYVNSNQLIHFFLDYFFKKSDLLLSTIISIMSLSLYCFIQNRILSNILITSRHINLNLLCTITNSVVSIIFALFAKTTVDLAWASNFAIFSQVLISFFISIYYKYIRFDLSHTLYFICSIIASFIIVKLPMISFIGLYPIYLLIFYDYTHILLQKK